MEFTDSPARRFDQRSTNHNVTLTTGSNIVAASVVATPLMIIVGALWAFSLAMNNHVGTVIAHVAPMILILWGVSLLVGGALCLTGRILRSTPSSAVDVLDDRTRAHTAH